MNNRCFYFLALLFFPVFSHACTVCFGGTDGNLNRGFFWGVVILGALPFTLIGSLISYVVYFSRKKRLR